MCSGKSYSLDEIRKQDKATLLSCWSTLWIIQIKRLKINGWGYTVSTLKKKKKIPQDWFGEPIELFLVEPVLKARTKKQRSWLFMTTIRWLWADGYSMMMWFPRLLIAQVVD